MHPDPTSIKPAIAIAAPPNNYSFATPRAKRDLTAVLQMSSCRSSTKSATRQTNVPPPAPPPQPPARPITYTCVCRVSGNPWPLFSRRTSCRQRCSPSSEGTALSALSSSRSSSSRREDEEYAGGRAVVASPIGDEDGEESTQPTNR